MGTPWVEYGKIISDPTRFTIVLKVNSSLEDDSEILEAMGEVFGREHRIYVDRCVRALTLSDMYYPIPELVFDLDVDSVEFTRCTGKFPSLTREHSNFSAMEFLTSDRLSFNFPASLEYLVNVKWVCLWGYHKISSVYLTLPSLMRMDVEGSYDDPEGILDKLRQKGVVVRIPPREFL